AAPRGRSTLFRFLQGMNTEAPRKEGLMQPDFGREGQYHRGASIAQPASAAERIQAPGGAGQWSAWALDLLQRDRLLRWMGAALLVWVWFSVMGFTLRASGQLSEFLSGKGSPYPAAYFLPTVALTEPVKGPEESDEAFQKRQKEYKEQ